MTPTMFAFLLVLAAQAPPPAQVAKCSVEGQVIKATTGEPLKKAAVALIREASREARGSSYATTTDANGRFAIKDVEPGRYRLSADRNGYLRQEYGQRRVNRPGTVLTLEPGQRLSDLVLRLSPFAVIAGRVMDEDGEPVANVRIQALRDAFEMGRRQLAPAGGASTNDLGEYRVFGLEPGRYYLSARSWNDTLVMRRAVASVSANAPEEDYVALFFPGVLDPGQATPIEVAAAAEVRGVDFRLVRMRTIRIRGRVLNEATGQSTRSAMLLLERRGARSMMPYGRAVVDPQGAFEIRGVAPGAYTLVAHLFEDGKRYSASVPVDAGNTDIENLVVTLRPGFNVNGVVRVEGGGEKAAGMLVMLDKAGENAVSAAQVKANGEFSLINVPADSYLISVRNLPADLYVKAARLGSMEALDAGLDLSAGRPGAQLEIVLSPAGGRIEGVVLNAKQQPAGGATVVLVPEQARRSQNRLYKWVTADQNGRYTLRGIAPGEYKLFAWEDVETQAWLAPEFLRPYEKLGETMRIDEGARATAQLQVIATEGEGPAGN